MPSIIKAANLEVVPPDNYDVKNDGNDTIVETATETSEAPSNKSSVEEGNGSDPNESYEEITEETVVYARFSNLIGLMAKSQYDKNLVMENDINEKCRQLFERDYKVEIVTNDVCANYPKEIWVPVSEKTDKETNCMNFDAKLYSELVKGCKVARLRSRFVAPVILFDNKFVCRSGTLCVWTSAVYENVKASIPSIADSVRAVFSPFSAAWNFVVAACDTAQFVLGDDALKNQHAKDAEILKLLKVDRICDLMVEYNKHFRDLLYVSSTEKVNDEIYKGMKMEEMPYPGCEFFEEYCKKGRKPEGLLFNWEKSEVTRTLVLTVDPKLFFPDMDIENFKEWDLIILTQKYLKVILLYLLTGTGGMLVHCISGWDRTPLFVSLIRLSLWADGVIHKSLKYQEMTYLTVAYDWYLFGHNLPDRLEKKEEIMHFCFNFLQHIASDEFSITRMFKELDPEITKYRTFPEFVSGQRKCLNDIRDYVMKAYDSRIPNPKN